MIPLLQQGRRESVRAKLGRPQDALQPSTVGSGSVQTELAQSAKCAGTRRLPRPCSNDHLCWRPGLVLVCASPPIHAPRTRRGDPTHVKRSTLGFSCASIARRRAKCARVPPPLSARGAPARVWAQSRHLAQEWIIRRRQLVALVQGAVDPHTWACTRAVVQYGAGTEILHHDTQLNRCAEI